MSDSSRFALPAERDRASTPRAGSLDDVYTEHAGYVHRLALRLTGSGDDADEVTQDVFVAALEGLGSLREPAKARSWLRTVTVRKCQRRLRWRAFTRRFREVPSWEAWPETRERDAGLAHALAAALDGLPVRERSAWVLRHVEGLELVEVAEAAGCSLATVKRRIGRATERLQRRMGHE